MADSVFRDGPLRDADDPALGGSGSPPPEGAPMDIDAVLDALTDKVHRELVGRTFSEGDDRIYIHAVLYLAWDALGSSAALTAEVERLRGENAHLREAVAECAIPYTALLRDTKSRKWIAPIIWEHMVRAHNAAWAALVTTAPPPKEPTNGNV